MATKMGKDGDKSVPRCPLCENLIKADDDAELVGEIGEGNARLVCQTCSERQDENRQLTEF